MTWRQVLAARAPPRLLPGLGIVVLSFWLVITGLTGRDDHLARRWKTKIADTETPEFTKLLGSPPDKSSPLPTYPGDWRKTQVAVYTVPTIKPPHSRPTLRDLADVGQAHAI